MKIVKIEDKYFEACETCGRKAQWSYIPGDFSHCDKHVHRGCSCNNYSNEPCCEYFYDVNGWEIEDLEIIQGEK